MAVNNLSPWQQFLKQFDKGGATDEQLRKAADQFFGPIPIPPGSQIIYQDGGRAEWIDPQGYKHSAQRSLDGRDPNAGKLIDNTDRPKILPDQATQGLQSQLSGSVAGLSAEQFKNLEALARGENPAGLDPGTGKRLGEIDALTARLQAMQGLQGLDPETQALLDQISGAEQAKLKQQFDDQSSSLIAQLYGNRTNQSSIAGQNAAQLTQSQGLVTQQQLADAAMRKLSTQQYLTEAERANLQLALSGMMGANDQQLQGFQAQQAAAQNQANAWIELLNSLTGQQTSRDIAEGNLGLGYGQLAEGGRQANMDFEIKQQDADLRKKQAESTWNKINQGLGTVASLAGAVTGGLGAYQAGSKILTGGAGK